MQSKAVDHRRAMKPSRANSSTSGHSALRWWEPRMVGDGDARARTLSSSSGLAASSATWAKAVGGLGPPWPARNPRPPAPPPHRPTRADRRPHSRACGKCRATSSRRARRPGSSARSPAPPHRARSGAQENGFEQPDQLALAQIDLPCRAHPTSVIISAIRRHHLPLREAATGSRQNTLCMQPATCSATHHSRTILPFSPPAASLKASA